MAIKATAGTVFTTPRPKAKKVTSEATRRRLRWLPVLVAVLLITLWHYATAGSGAQSFVLASPQDVFEELLAMLGDGTLIQALSSTLLKIGLGFAVGVGAAFTLGYAIAHNRLLEQILNPYVVGFQAVPIVVIAPALSRFFQYQGMLTSIFVAALIVFFPMLMATILGIRGVSPELRALMRSLSANRWQTFTRLELPGALPALFAGLKISVILAIAGTVVGEAFNPVGGIGYLIYANRFVYNTAGVLVGVFALTALALALYELVARVERRLLSWQRAGR